MALVPPVPVIVGIAGGSGAGKTRLARLIGERFTALGVSLIDMDSYYRDRAHLSEAERRRVNYDEPSAIDHELLGRHLDQLSRGQAIPKPRYDFATHTRTAEHETVAPAALIIVEGIFALWEPRVREHFAVKVFVETESDLRLLRRLNRDVLERGRTVESVIEQYVEYVRPMHHAYVEPTRAHADFILSGEGADVEAPRIAERIDDLLAARTR
jgi:uridine kinase